MQLLDKKLEVLLKELSDADNTDYIDTRNYDCRHNELDALEESGYIEQKRNRSGSPTVNISLTYDGLHYFEQKQHLLNNNRKNNIKERVRYGITTVVAVGALIVSIVSLCIK